MDGEPTESNAVTFRWWDSDEQGNVRELENRDEFSKVLVEKQFRELDQQLEKATKLLSAIEESASKEGLESMKQHELEQEQQRQQAALPPLPRIANKPTWTKLQQRKIVELNNVLHAAYKAQRIGKLDSKLLVLVWKRYCAALPALREAWDHVPPEAWQCLWDVLASETKGNTNRMPHIYALAKDMNSAGVPLDGLQAVLAIEAMFIDGQQNDAIDSWKKSAGTLGSKPETAGAYWELGVRMCAIHGDLERAERAADTLFKSAPDANPRCLLHLIRAHLEKGNNEAAWQTYRRLKYLFGPSIQIEDYDEVVACFLPVGQTETAFHVFVDMMFSGASDADGKTAMSGRVVNQFFFGKWLKRLIGAGDLDGALKVVRFMQQKGVTGAAVQANGLIGALLRSGDAENQKAADKLAWAMIETRHNFVELRRQGELSQRPPEAKDVSRNDRPLVPRATLETYSLMAESYKNRGLLIRLEELWVAFQQAEIGTDGFMMNQLLQGYIQKGEVEGAHELYATMVKKYGVVPDAYTFLTLYKSLSVNRLYWVAVTDELRQDDAARCRALFRDMMTFSSAVVDGEESDVLQALARHVLHTFRKSGDYAGLVVALRALQPHFGFVPAEAITVEMLAESPDALRDTPGELSRMKRRTVKAIQTLETILAIRCKARGLFGGRLSPDEKAVEMAAAIELYFRKKIPAADEEVWDMYKAAAEDMGVPLDVLPPASP